MEIDQKTGKYKLSHRVLIEKPADYVERPARRERPERGDRRPRPERGERRPRPERQERRHHDEAPVQPENHEPKDFNDSLDKMDF